MVLAVLILAVPVGVAKTENIVMGPYKASFDMGNIGYYTINIKPPSEGENFKGISYTVYVAFINGTSPLKVRIGILSYSMPVRNNFEEAIRSALKSVSHGEEPMVINRTIDGKPGALSYISYSDSHKSFFGYPLGYYPENNTMTSGVLIESTYPWDGGTSALVKTIHVEKA